ncbi:MAG: methyltransferase [Candidatus Diapherotrites archaeon]|nr:methyltransferase [Candidatus Diapherotrites archaeon]
MIIKHHYKGKEHTVEVLPEVYEPKEDSYLLARIVQDQDLEGKNVLEVGCGSGLLSLLAAQNAKTVLAVDINPKAVENTKLNFEKNKITNAIVKESNLFEKVNGKFDLIIFNPPYLPDEPALKGKEEMIDKSWAGGPTGRETLFAFLKNAREHLNPDGEILILISNITGPTEVEERLMKLGFKFKEVGREKVPNEELIVYQAN